MNRFLVLYCSVLLLVLVRLANGDVLPTTQPDPEEIQIKELLPCKRINPCGATLSSYPLLEETESSGWGSGDTPVYDEVLTHDIYDYTSVASTTSNYTLCSCEDDQKCNFDDDSNLVKIDFHVSLRFCDLQHVSTVCKKNVPNVRIIGPAQQDGEGVAEVTTAVAFCNCANGFTRQTIEYWGGAEISLNYKCL